MHSLIAMNEDNQRLTENITWADNRANDYADLIEKSYGGFELYQRTGTPIHPICHYLKSFG